MMHVIATITALPGERDAMPALFRKSQPDVLAENECVSYEAVVNIPNFGTIRTPLGNDTLP